MSCQLYLLSPPQVPDAQGFAAVLHEVLAAGPVAAFQLRLKETRDAHIEEVARAILPVCQLAGTVLLINDRPDIARGVGADGAHIGQDDMPYKEAREILGQDAIIGVTCHDSRHLAFQAAERGADYVAFGAFFPTTTKDPKTSASLELLELWSHSMTVPAVAIGGISAQNVKKVAEAGADFAAISGYIWNHEQGPAAAVKELCAILGLSS